MQIQRRQIWLVLLVETVFLGILAVWILIRLDRIFEPVSLLVALAIINHRRCDRGTPDAGVCTHADHLFGGRERVEGTSPGRFRIERAWTRRGAGREVVGTSHGIAAHQPGRLSPGRCTQGVSSDRGTTPFQRTQELTAQTGARIESPLLTICYAATTQPNSASDDPRILEKNWRQ